MQKVLNMTKSTFLLINVYHYHCITWRTKKQKTTDRCITLLAECLLLRQESHGFAQTAEAKNTQLIQREFVVEFYVYHYSGGTLQKCYEIKKLHQAHNFSLMLTDHLDEAFVENEINSILVNEFPRTRIEDFHNSYLYYQKTLRKNKIKKHVGGFISLMQLIGLKSMTTKDHRKIVH